VIPANPGAVLAYSTNTSATGAFVTNVFEPSRIQPSPSGFAVAASASALDPDPGSVMAAAPMALPSASLGNHCCFWASVP
jgi:hypothetical protein